VNKESKKLITAIHEKTFRTCRLTYRNSRTTRSLTAVAITCSMVCYATLSILFGSSSNKGEELFQKGPAMTSMMMRKTISLIFAETGPDV